MKIKFANDEFEAERIIKGFDFIRGLNGDTVVFEFRGIQDFSVFELLEGEYEEYVDEKQKIAELEQQNAELLLDLAMKDARIMEIEQTQADLFLNLTMKGVI